MAFDSAYGTRPGGWGTIEALVTADGSAAHRMVRRLMTGVPAMRDLSDAVHALSALHGRHPGVIDHAAGHTHQPAMLAWLGQTGQAFATERDYLARLTAAAGPMPSTPGQAESEAAGSAQRHALDMLAQSDRAGCAVGAAIALAVDWVAVRRVLDLAARRFGMEAAPLALPPYAETASLMTVAADTPAVERAMAFGAQQLLAQHRGLWTLLDARASARDHPARDHH
ncbi:MAG: hypothetical protein M3R41_08135 [Pseudomonadota bacterium]|nr:hypothetical protein [Pseudomonadota bacterium]